MAMRRASPGPGIVLFVVLKIRRHDVQEQGVDAGAGQKGGDAASHHAGTDNGGFLDAFDHNDLLADP